MSATALHYGFQPDALRARELDARMRQRLGESLDYLVGELRPFVAVDNPAYENFRERLRRDRAAPLTFALYGELIRATDREDFTAAQDVLSTLLRQAECRSPLQILDLADPATDARAQIYARYVDTDPALPMHLAPPSPEASERTRAALRETLALLDAADPELAGEVRELLREIVLCGNRQKEGTSTFEGASAFLLWGAVLLNTQRDNSILAVAQVLAHESAHNLLFALCPDEPLLHNDPEEKFGSPLRPDLRPLEGIYHATYVVARMHRALRQLAGSGLLPAAQEKQAREETIHTQRQFRDGLRTLELHGHPTEIGAHILNGAKEYMSSAARCD